MVTGSDCEFYCGSDHWVETCIAVMVGLLERTSAFAGGHIFGFRTRKWWTTFVNIRMKMEN